jgi:hypothetical protein
MDDHPDPLVAAAQAAAQLLAPPAGTAPSALVFVLESRLQLRGDAAAEEAASRGHQAHVDVEGSASEATLAHGLACAERTLREALEIVTLWSEQPGAWTDAARTDRWHTSGRREDEVRPAPPEEAYGYDGEEADEVGE